MTWSDRFSALLLTLYGCVALWLVVSAHPFFTSDDGYYYLKIAQNVIQGNGIRFDGRHVTNGFQPLWLINLLPIWLLTDNTQTALHLAMALQGFYLILGMLLVFKIARLTYDHLISLLAALVWFEITYRVSLSGLEFSLYALCFLAAAYLTLRGQQQPEPLDRRAYLVLGGVLSLLFLARLDTIFLALVLGAWFGYRARSIGQLRHLLWFAAPIIVVVVLYAGISTVLFGHILPVSGALKREWSQKLLLDDPVYQSYGWLIAKAAHLLRPLRVTNQITLALGVFGTAIWSAIYQITGRRHPVFQNLGALLPMMVFGWMSYLMFGLSYHYFNFSPWYYVAQRWLPVMLMAALLHYAVRRWKIRAVLAAAFVIVPLVTAVGIRRFTVRQASDEGNRALENALAWADEHLPPDAVIGSWNAGTIGYFSRHTVINLDGLVNSWDYFEMGQYDLCVYWEQEHITHLMDAFEDTGVIRLPKDVPTYTHCTDHLELIWSAPQPQQQRWRMAIFKINHP